MKKLLFVLAFAFIGQQAFSQMYIATLMHEVYLPNAGCNQSELVLVKVDATGNQTTTCIQSEIVNGSLITLNQELNNIVSQGYQLIETSSSLSSDGGYGGLVSYNGYLNSGVTFIFAIP